MRLSILLALALCAAPAYSQKLPDFLSPQELRERSSQVEESGVPLPVAVVEGPRGPVHTTHRLEGTVFPHYLGVYTRDQSTYRLRFSVYFQAEDHKPFAERAGKLLGILWGMADRRIGPALSRLRETPVSLWMTRGGDPGAEQHAANLFLYNVLSPRSGIEWIRELTHEYGHYLLPGATGYSQPESWSNGMLGERLFSHWLLQDLNQAKISREALPFASANEIREYCERQVFPLLDPMRSRGPQPGILSGTDERALDAHTGFMLFVDATYGSRALVELLEYLPPSRTNTPQGIDFLVAFITWTREEPVQTISLPNSGSTMVYLSRGEFIIRRNAGRGNLALNGAAIQGSDSEWTIRVVTAGWRLLTLSDSDSTRTLRLQRRAPG